MMSYKQELLKLTIVVLFLKGIQSAIIKINDGQIEGSEMNSRLGKTFHAFRGIPFAKPPIGELRFEDPWPVDSWKNVLNAQNDGPICPQPNTFGTFKTSEDCLHLNVYTEVLPSGGNVKLKPVIAYIHGGGFVVGSGISEGFAGPEIIMDRDIVFVTMNYRLALLGFLSTGTKEAPGNVGFKDQVMALKWIQKNIAYFGGDPNRVTIAGQSAGGMSVSVHMVSPMSTGLFHRVIAISGAITWQMQFEDNQLDLAKKQAQLLNCPDDDMNKLFTCLRRKSSEEISNTVSSSNDIEESSIIAWGPVIEKDFGQERFLIDDLIKLFREGNFHKVPVIAGITENEFIDPARTLLDNNLLLQRLNDDFEEIAPMLFLYERNTEKSKEISKKLREAYLPFDVIDRRSFNALNNLFADSVIGFGVHRFVHLIANYTDVYYYKFTFKGRYSFFNYPKDKPYGVQHSDDLQYVLYCNIFPMITSSDPENIAVERSTQVWEQFAMTGNPNSAEEVILNDLTWNKYDVNLENYLEIGTHLVQKNGLYLERFKIWDELFTESSSSISWLLKKIPITLLMFITFLIIVR